MKKKREQCFCAFCKTPRVVYLKKHVQALDVFLALISSFLIVYFFTQTINPIFLIVFIFFIVLMEGVIQIRWRISIVCSECGFDPILYLKDSDKAALKVTDCLDRRKNSIQFWTKKPLNLPARKNSNSLLVSKKSVNSTLSKRV